MTLPCYVTLLLRMLPVGVLDKMHTHTHRSSVLCFHHEVAVYTPFMILRLASQIRVVPSLALSHTVFLFSNSVKYARTHEHANSYLRVIAKDQAVFLIDMYGVMFKLCAPNILPRLLATAKIVSGCIMRVSGSGPLFFKDRFCTPPQSQEPSAPDRRQPWAPCHRVFLFASLRPPEAVLRGDRGHRTAH